MKLQLIHIDNYLVAVDDSKLAHQPIVFGQIKGIKVGDIVLEGYVDGTKGLEQIDTLNDIDVLLQKRLTHHLPLNNAPTLEGVSLLPPLEVVKYDFAEIFYNICKATIEHFDDWVEAKEYNKSKAKEKYMYTEEDMRDAYNLGLDADSKLSPNKTYDTLIQSLQQPKYPVAFECEMVDKGEEDWIGDDINGEPFWNQKLEPKTITNSQGLTQLVGKYIYL
jgi:hypothetical protein